MKITYCAGHDLSTSGKRVPAALDDARTREWVLNDRIADAFAKAAENYPELLLLRTDDPLGITTVPIAKRTAKANAWDADLYIDMHHNAGIELGKGGGLTIFSYPGARKGSAYRNRVYEALLAAGAPKGNRSQPLREKKFLSLSKTKMPAILVEYAFMDSPSDWEAICDPDFPERMGAATLQGVLQAAMALGVYRLPTLSAKKNPTHPAVKWVQNRLWQLGYTQVGAADGIAGPKFTAAVKAFQKAQGCVTDGELTADGKTWRKLMEAQV
jgi:hypothetical protein